MTTELWSPAEIADALDVRSRDTISRWQRMEDFPEPVKVVGLTRLYNSADVLAWHAAYKGNPKKRRVLELYREDKTRSTRTLADLAETSAMSVSRWLRELGEVD